VVGIVEDGNYASLAEDPQPAMFLSILQWPSTQVCLVVRSDGDPQQLAAAIKSTVQGLDAGLPLDIRTWNHELESALFPSPMATLSLGVLGVLGAVLSITRSLWNGCVLGQQTAAGVGDSHGPRGAEQGSVGLLATWIPAQRALSVDPVILLREERTSAAQAANRFFDPQDVA
jgi:hypothetical protein